VPQSHRFAVARGRAHGALPNATPKYERAEAGPLTTSADTDAECASFSGHPDTIVLSAQAFGAIFTLQDFMRRAITELHVPAGGTQESFVRARRVMVRNAVAGSNAIVMAVGKWADFYEAE
jgi:hypothetical protein